MNTWLSLLSSWLVDVLVLGTVVLALATVVMLFLRQPAARMGVAWGTMLGLALLCLLAAFPLWPRHALFGAREPAADVEMTVDESDQAALRAIEQSSAALPAPIPQVIPPLPVADAPAGEKARTASSFLAKGGAERLAMGAWLCGFALATGWILLGAWQALRLVRRAKEPPEWTREELALLVRKSRRHPRLKMSAEISTALALGAARPHILLAAGNISLENAGQVRAALAHEWAHIRNWDLWLLVVERLLLPVFCLHPLFWLLRRQIRMSQELLADAAAAGESRIEYAEALVAWAKSAPAAAPPLGMAALSLWENPCSLTRRVEMLLHSKTPVSTARSRWGWLTTLCLLALVASLSLVTLRPAAIGQEAGDDRVERPAKPKKPKKEKVKKGSITQKETKIEFAAPPAPPAGLQTHLQMKIGQIDHAALDKAETNIGDIIQEASEDHCRLEGNLIVAELSQQQFDKLLENLQKANCFTVLSQPQIITLDGQEAKVQVGGQVPFVRLEKAVNGEATRRVEFKDVGEMISICPRLKDGTHFTLDIALEHTQLLKNPPAEAPEEMPVFNTRKIQLTTETEMGQTLVITEKPPRKGDARQPFPLLAIRAEKLAAPAPSAEKGDDVRVNPGAGVRVNVPAHGPKPLALDFAFPNTRKARDESRTQATAELIEERLSKAERENDALRQQVQDLQAKVIDLQVQLQWLRAAATPEGKEKVTDEEFVRRVYLDLTGLLPTPEDVRTFLQDKDPQKRSKVIDKLLPNKAGDDPISKRWKEIFRTPDDRKSGEETAEHAPNPALTRAAAAATVVKIFRLSHASAADVAKTLEKIVDGKGADALSIAVDERTNSIVAKGTPDVLALVAALLTELDRAELRDESSAKPKSGDQGVNEAESREWELKNAQADYEHWLRQLTAPLRGNANRTNVEAEAALHQAELRLERVSGKSIPQLELERTSSALQAAQAQLDRATKLVQQGLIAKHELDAMQAEVGKWNLEVERAKARLEYARAKVKPKLSPSPRAIP